MRRRGEAVSVMRAAIRTTPAKCSERWSRLLPSLDRTEADSLPIAELDAVNLLFAVADVLATNNILADHERALVALHDRREALACIERQEDGVALCGAD